MGSVPITEGIQLFAIIFLLTELYDNINHDDDGSWDGD